MEDKTMKPVDPYKELQSIMVSECYFIYLIWIYGELSIGQPASFQKQFSVYSSICDLESHRLVWP